MKIVDGNFPFTGGVKEVHGKAFEKGLKDNHRKLIKKATSAPTNSTAICKTIDDAVAFQTSHEPEEPSDITHILEPWKKPKIYFD